MGRWRSAYATRDLTTGSIPRNLWFLAWPQVIEGFLRIVDQIADLVWAGFLGTVTLAGMGVAQQYTQLAWTGRGGIDIAQRALISRAVGMGDRDLANHILLQAWTVTLGFGAVMVVIGVFFTEPLLRLLGLSDVVVAAGTTYMRIQFISSLAQAFQQVSGHALGAAGDTLSLMKSTAIARVVHIFLSPMLVFGLLGFPEMGIAGAAMANLIAYSLAAALLFLILFLGTSRLHPRLKNYRFDGPMLWQIIKLGGPAAVTTMERSMAQLVLVRFVAPFGNLAVATFTVTRRVELFANLGSQGMGLASGVLVGQNLGAGRPDRARQTVLWATGYVLVIKGILGAFLFAFPLLVLSIFSRDADFKELAAVWIRIQVMTYLALGVGQVLLQSFQAAGDTVTPMLITIVPVWAIEVPLAYALSRFTGLGLYGVAWASVVAQTLRSLAFVAYFYWGPWLKKAVFTHQTGAPVLSGAGEAPAPPTTRD